MKIILTLMNIIYKDDDCNDNVIDNINENVNDRFVIDLEEQCYSMNYFLKLQLQVKIRLKNKFF